MSRRVRVLSIVVPALLLAQFEGWSYAQPTADARLAQNVTVSSPAQGESMTLDSVAVFNRGGGYAIIDSGNAFAETFSYTGLDFDAHALLGVSRSEPRAHPSGAVVRPLGDEAAAQPSPRAVEPGETNDDEIGDESERETQEQVVRSQGAAARDSVDAEETSDRSSEEAPSSNVVDEICDQYLSGCDVAAILGELCDGDPLLCEAPGDPEALLEGLCDGDPLFCELPGPEAVNDVAAELPAGFGVEAYGAGVVGPVLDIDPDLVRNLDGDTLPRRLCYAFPDWHPGYNKPSRTLNIHEWTDVKIDSNCGSRVTIGIQGWIYHDCVPGGDQTSPRARAEGQGPGPHRDYTDQIVSGWSFPYNWCGHGTRIHFRYRAWIQGASFDQRCYETVAVFPNPPPAGGEVVPCFGE